MKSEVDIMLESDGKLKMLHQLYSASWFYICEKVNNHNARYIAGEVDTIMRVFCPWQGEELYVPLFLEEK